MTPFDYWAPSRMMPPQSSITEFPFFTFLFADLHAHLMAIPFDVVILGVGLSLVLGDRQAIPNPRQREFISWLGVCVLGLLVGVLRPINSWDYPPFLLISVIIVFIAERADAGRLDWTSAADGRREVARAGRAVRPSLLPLLAELSPLLQGFPRAQLRRRRSISTCRTSASFSSPARRWSSHWAGASSGGGREGRRCSTW